MMTYYCLSCSDLVAVATPDGLCPKCEIEKAQGYKALALAGRCANGMELGHGSLNHAVLLGQRTAMCGAKPGRRSVGWTTPYQSREVTCPRCAKKVQS